MGKEAGKSLFSKKKEKEKSVSVIDNALLAVGR